MPPHDTADEPGDCPDTRLSLCMPPQPDVDMISSPQNAAVDHEAPDHQVVPGAWRAEGVLREVRNVTGPTFATREAKKVRVYLKHYYNNIGSVHWQIYMI